MLRNSPVAYLSHYDNTNKPYVNADLNVIRRTFAWTGLRLEQINVKSEIFSQFEVRLVLSVQEEALQFEGALVIIIAFLELVGQRMEISLVYTMIVGTLLRVVGVTYRSQLQLLLG